MKASTLIGTTALLVQWAFGSPNHIAPSHSVDAKLLESSANGYHGGNPSGAPPIDDGQLGLRQDSRPRLARRNLRPRNAVTTGGRLIRHGVNRVPGAGRHNGPARPVHMPGQQPGGGVPGGQRRLAKDDGHLPPWYPPTIPRPPPAPRPAPAPAPAPAPPSS